LKMAFVKTNRITNLCWATIQYACHSF